MQLEKWLMIRCENRGGICVNVILPGPFLTPHIRVERTIQNARERRSLPVAKNSTATYRVCIPQLLQHILVQGKDSVKAIKKSAYRTPCRPPFARSKARVHICKHLSDSRL